MSATPPTLVTEYESTWTPNAASKTAAVTVSTGDLLCILAVTADDATTLTNPPTGGGLTYTLQQNVTVVDFCQIYIWTCPPVGGGQSFTLTVSEGSAGVDIWGFNCLQFAGSDGIGASAKTNVASGAPALDLATTQDHSAVAVIAADWNGADGAARVWRRNYFAFTEQTYFTSAGVYTVYGGFYPDAAAGGNTVTAGLTAPSTQKYSIAAVEIKGRLDVASPATPGALAVVRHFAPIRRK